MPDTPVQSDEGLKVYYLSLTRGLKGYYVMFKAESEEVVRSHALKYFGELWCSIYTAAYFREIIRKRYPAQSRIVNRDRPIVLTSPDGSWE
jgi:hypothetical protein